MRQDWGRRRMLGALVTAGGLTLPGCGGVGAGGTHPQPTQSETPATSGTPGRTTAIPTLPENRKEVSWFVAPGALFNTHHYGGYLYDISRLREHSNTVDGQPTEDLDLTAEDLTHLGIAPDQIDSLLKIDGITRSEPEILTFFGSFDESLEPTLDDGEIVATTEYENHSIYRVSVSSGSLAFAVGSESIVLASDTAKRTPARAAKAPIAASLGELSRYQEVSGGFGSMLDALWDGAIIAVGTHASFRNGVRTNPETMWQGSVGVGSSVRLDSQTSDIRISILYPTVGEAETREESVARRARKSDELHSSWAEQRDRLVVLTGKRATNKISL